MRALGSKNWVSRPGVLPIEVAVENPAEDWVDEYEGPEECPYLELEDARDTHDMEPLPIPV